MRAQTRVSTWRSTLHLVLLALILISVTGSWAQAAPPLEIDAQGVNAAGDHLITQISLGPDTPNILRFNNRVEISFAYSTTEADGVRIFARPFTNGALTPNYSAHGSPLYPTSATGQGSGYFTITAGQVVVDQIRFRMTDADQSTLLFETFVPVHYFFGDPTHLVTDISLSPDTPNVLAFGQNVQLRFNYSTRQTGGVRIFARPFTNGALTPNYAAHGSPVYPIGGGSATGSFTISTGGVVVDQIRIQMWDAGQNTLLFEAFLPVYYRFWDDTHIVTNVAFEPDTPNVFKYGEDVDLTFDYNTGRKGVRIWARPFSGPNLSPNYAAHGSPLYSGSGSGTGSFNLTAGPTVVDKVRIQMWDDGQDTLLFEAFLPVHLFWAGAGPPPGPDMQIDAVEVTQAIQDLNNSVDLVANKRTYVRVHTSSPVNVADVFATLHGRRGWVTLNPVLTPGNPGADITVLTSPDRGQLNDSFWFELPSSWTAPGSLTLTARLDPNNAKNDLAQGNNVRTTTVNFLNSPPLRLRLVNVQYTQGGSTYMAANSHLDALESWLRRAYPIPNLVVSRQTLVYPTSGLPDVDTLHGWLALTKLLRMLFSGEDSRVVYYGVVDDGGGFMRGKAAGIPGTVAAGPSGTDTWGWDFDGSYNDWYGGHEIGHTRGRYHAEFCGAGGGVAYPYPSGRISPDLSGDDAIYGFDITTRDIYGPNWKDVMTYCSNQWVSDYTYEGIRSYLVGLGLNNTTAAQITASEFLVLVGLADLQDHSATLENAYLIAQENTLPLPEPGDWTIALVDGADHDLATYAFAPDELTGSEESPGRPAVIAEVVPWASGTVRVEIRYDGQVTASRTASANPPSVELLTPADGATLSEGPFTASWAGSDLDGDPLTYSVLYSNDGGANWQTLAANLADTELGLNTDDLPGGPGMLRVVASDGLLTGQDTGGAFQAPLHAPEVQIVQPTLGQVFFPTQQVALQGAGYDLEDGTMDDAAFAWSSDVQGFLGSGASLNTSLLSTGSHVLTLEVTDSDGMSSQAKREIEIADGETPEAVILSAAPVGVAAVTTVGAKVMTDTLTLRSSSEDELDWTASVDVPWLSLDASTGQTPSDLGLTLDPGGLPVGTHTGQVTVEAPQAENSPATIHVTLQITGTTTYLPVVQRAD